MTRRIGVAVTTLAFAVHVSVVGGAEEQDTRVQELTVRIEQLEGRVRKLEARLPPPEEDAQTRAAMERTRAQRQAREEQDRTAYTQEQRREIDNLYRLGSSQIRSPQGQESLRQLAARYPKANRTGCAVLYLGQMSTGEERVQYLETAVREYSDCWYGDGVQVGAYARFLLADCYSKSGKAMEATALLDEIRKDYPEAADHSGRLLVDMMPK